ncbi:MAG: histidine kinase N-terminal 7TM domain-containing protein [Terracidiphilus sp.]
MNDFNFQLLGNELWLTMAAIALLEAIAIHVWRYRRERGAIPLIGFQVGKTIWLLGTLVAACATHLATQIFWIDAAFLAGMALSYAGFRFLAELWELKRTTLRWIDGVNLTILASYAAVMYSDRWHHLYWRANGFDLASTLRGGLLQAFWGWVSLGLNLIYLLLVAGWAIRERGVRRRQAQMILLAVLISWATMFLTQNPAMRAMGSLPIGFALSSLVMTWAFLRLRLVGLVPLAEETVLNERVEGLMILDASGRILALNPSARALFPALQLAEGDSFEKVASDWPELTALADGGVGQLDASRSLDGRPRIFEVAQMPLRNPIGHSLGQVITFTDVTGKRNEQSRKLSEHTATTLIEERQRLGRELHDRGQLWQFLSSQAQTLEHLLKRNETQRALEIVRRVIAVLEENFLGMRESMLALQSELNEENNLQQAIEEQLDWYRRHCGMDAELLGKSAWQPRRVSLHAQAQLLRIAQEALANTRKHAAAKRVRVEVQLESDRLRMCIHDDGCGFDVAKGASLRGHFGLKTMRERAESVGASFELETAPGAGSRITVDLPLA